jgi:N-acetylglutamate synthase-like GNAT family acetyltransferase
MRQTPNASSTCFDLAPAGRDDLPELVALLGAAVPHCLPETVWQLPYTHHRYLVARDERGAMVAAGSLEPLDGHRAEIRGLVVDPAFRGRGLASEIVRQLLRRARTRGLDALCVTRKPAFFQRLGFRATAPHWLSLQRRLAPQQSNTPRVSMAAPLNRPSSWMAMPLERGLEAAP